MFAALIDLEFRILPYVIHKPLANSPNATAQCPLHLRDETDSSATMRDGTNHYAVLSLNPPDSGRYLSQEEVKLAYRRALLHYHPDKSKTTNKAQPTNPKYTIDEVAAAYRILSDPLSRSEFDRALRLHDSKSLDYTTDSFSGLETIDLDDMMFDNEANLWYRPCRCGNLRGYLISERDLEKDAEQGEIITGCGGCSLWLCVVFQQVEP